MLLNQHREEEGGSHEENILTCDVLGEPDRSAASLAAICWTKYYQAKFKLFLLKNKITLGDIRAEVITTGVDHPGVEIKWAKIKHSDTYTEIDFQRWSL